ncbi:MAG TPA: twin-arginine translocase TatA/TatE family subunit [Gemmatimonadaceae bacterium]|nr:twin-arginine translocase TatA/TatE family subunit [Gemmatimonadaceae bacterium]
MFGIGPEKILLLALVVLLLFGAKRIPEIGSSFGKGIRDFKKSLAEGSHEEPSANADPRAFLREAEPPAHTESREAEWQPRRLGQ